MRGIEQLYELLDLIRNPEKYEAAVKRLVDLDNSIKANSEALGDLAKASDLKNAAQQVLDKAKEQVAALKKEADEALAARQKVFDDEFAKLQEQRSEANDLANKGNNALAEAAAKEKDLVAREKALRESLARLAEQQKAVSEKELEVADRLVKLRSVMA